MEDIEPLYNKVIEKKRRENLKKWEKKPKMVVWEIRKMTLQQ